MPVENAVPEAYNKRTQLNPAMYVTILSCFEPMTVSRETYIGLPLTCPRKGTSKAILRTPTCESGFETRKSDGICGFFCAFFGLHEIGKSCALHEDLIR